MIVADATPLIHLSRIGHLDLLHALFRAVTIPPKVYDEVVVKGEAQGSPDALTVKEAVGPWIVFGELNEEQGKAVEALVKSVPLGLGEAACLVLARGLQVPVVLDDLVAAKTAQRLGLTTYWTTSILLRAVSRGLLTRAEGREAVEALVRSGLHIRSDVLVELLRSLEE